MRSLIALGVVSLFGIAATAACGDDDSGGSNNVGGTGGSSAGTGGTGGTGGGAAGTAGTGGGTGGTSAGGTGGTGTTPPPGPLATCEGCVELIVPATGPNDNGGTTNLADQAGFQFTFATPVDFSDGIVTWRVAAVEPNANYFVTLYAQNGQALGFAGAYQFFALDPVAFPANQFRDIVIDLAAVAAAPGDAGAPDASTPPVVDVDAGAADAGDGGVVGPVLPNVIGTFDKSQIVQLGATIGVGAAFTGSAVVRVAVDQVSFQNVPGQETRTFTAGVEGLAINNYQVPPQTPAPYHHP